MMVCMKVQRANDVDSVNSECVAELSVVDLGGGQEHCPSQHPYMAPLLGGHPLVWCKTATASLLGQRANGVDSVNSECMAELSVVDLGRGQEHSPSQHTYKGCLLEGQPLVWCKTATASLLGQRANGVDSVNSECMAELSVVDLGRGQEHSPSQHTYKGCLLEGQPLVCAQQSAASQAGRMME